MTKTTAAAVEATETKKVEFNQATYDKLLGDHKTVSGVIRHLASTGMSRGDIAKTTGKRYQHVRNVLVQPLKKA
jgi:TRAP-type uncharacterized transport system substrate-binding protein